METIFEIIFKALVELAVFFGLDKLFTGIKKIVRKFFNLIRPSNKKKGLIVIIISTILNSCTPIPPASEKNKVVSNRTDSLKNLMQKYISDGEKYCDTLIKKIQIRDTVHTQYYIEKIKLSENEAKKIFNEVTDLGKKGILNQVEYEKFMNSIQADSIQRKINYLEKLGIIID